MSDSNRVGATDDSLRDVPTEAEASSSLSSEFGAEAAEQGANPAPSSPSVASSFRGASGEGTQAVPDRENAARGEGDVRGGSHKESHTSIANFLRCPRLYQLKNHLGYRSKVKRDDVLEFGDLVHRGQAAWFTASLLKSKDDLRLKATTKAIDSAPGFSDQHRELASLLMMGYHARWFDEPIETLAVERPFEVRLNGMTLVGVIDAIIRHDSRVYVVEHKTTKEELGSGSPYWDRLSLDPQISDYMLGARALGYDPAGVVYDVIRKPEIKSALPLRQQVLFKVVQSPEAYYQRRLEVRLGRELTEATNDVIAASGLIKLAKERNAFPRNPEACGRFGRRCEFWHVCRGEADVNNSARFWKRGEK